MDDFFNYLFTCKFLHMREVFAGYTRKNKFHPRHNAWIEIDTASTWYGKMTSPSAGRERAGKGRRGPKSDFSAGGSHERWSLCCRGHCWPTLDLQTAGRAVVPTRRQHCHPSLTRPFLPNYKLWDMDFPSYNELTRLVHKARVNEYIYIQYTSIHHQYTWYICWPLHNLWTVAIVSHESSEATPAMTVDSTGEAAPVRRSYSMAGWTGRKPKEAGEETCGKPSIGRRNVWYLCVFNWEALLLFVVKSMVETWMWFMYDWLNILLGSETHVAMEVHGLRWCDGRH